MGKLPLRTSTNVFMRTAPSWPIYSPNPMRVVQWDPFQDGVGGEFKIWVGPSYAQKSASLGHSNPFIHSPQVQSVWMSAQSI